MTEHLSILAALARDGSEQLQIAEAAREAGDPALARRLLDSALADAEDVSALLEVAEAAIAAGTASLAEEAEARAFALAEQDTAPSGWVLWSLGARLAERDLPAGQGWLRRAIACDDTTVDELADWICAPFADELTRAAGLLALEAEVSTLAAEAVEADEDDDVWFGFDWVRLARARLAAGDTKGAERARGRAIADALARATEEASVAPLVGLSGARRPRLDRVWAAEVLPHAEALAVSADDWLLIARGWARLRDVDRATRAYEAASRDPSGETSAQIIAGLKLLAAGDDGALDRLLDAARRHLEDGRADDWVWLFHQLHTQGREAERLADQAYARVMRRRRWWRRGVDLLDGCVPADGPYTGKALELLERLQTAPIDSLDRQQVAEHAVRAGVPWASEYRRRCLRLSVERDDILSLQDEADAPWNAELWLEAAVRATADEFDDLVRRAAHEARPETEHLFALRGQRALVKTLMLRAAQTPALEAVVKGDRRMLNDDTWAAVVQMGVEAGLVSAAAAPALRWYAPRASRWAWGVVNEIPDDVAFGLRGARKLRAALDARLISKARAVAVHRFLSRPRPEGAQAREAGS
jgi:hypothetical protein